MVSIQKFGIIVLVSNRIEYLSNYSIRNFEHSHVTNSNANKLDCISFILYYSNYWQIYRVLVQLLDHHV